MKKLFLLCIMIFTVGVAFAESPALQSEIDI